MIEISELSLPRHLVIIPDGNGRWAKRYGMDVSEGHLKGAAALEDLIEKIQDLDIDVLTVWGFSTENWKRSGTEVTGLTSMTEGLILEKGVELAKKGIRFKHIGRRDRLPTGLVAAIESLEELTKENQRKTLVLAFDYGGRDEIVRAANKLEGQNVTEESFKNLLDTTSLPDPDLIIRTAGEMRTSGIMPYQAVYAEIISSSVLFPDFDEKELLRCLGEYSRRQRRFGARPDLARPSLVEWLGLVGQGFGEYQSKLIPLLNKEAVQFINEWRGARLYHRLPPLQEDIKVYQRLLSGGKKLRPGLVVLGFENYLGEDQYRSGVLRAAIIYEMMHNGILIHDDIEDNSPMRRGEHTVHEYYRYSHQRRKALVEDRQYGIAIAINSGSLGITSSLNTLWRRPDIKPDRLIRMQRWFGQVLEMVTIGQRLDLTAMPLRDLTRQEVYRIHYLKTAYYTVTGPLGLGAILAGCSRVDLARLNSFGANLGIAFQIIDDHLGLYGDEKILGKPVGSDTTEAKKTLQFFLAYQLANKSQKRFLESIWGKKDLTTDELNMTRDLIDQLGVKNECLTRAQNLAEKSRSLLPRLIPDPIIRTFLGDLVNQVVFRSY